ncbi:hypothetical protein ABTN30_19985, partial [Acinetobacter baumannii]
TVGQVLSTAQAGYGYDALVGAGGQSVPQQAALTAPPRARREAFRLPFIDVANAATTEGQPAGKSSPVLRVQPTISHAAESVQLGGGGPVR